MSEIEREKSLGHDLQLQIYQVPGIEWGTTLVGMLNGYEFDAFVIPEPTPCPGWGLGDGKLLHLEVRRWIDDQQVFLWDRGPEVGPTDQRAEQIVEFVVRGLSRHAEQIQAALKEVLSPKEVDQVRESHKTASTLSERSSQTAQRGEEEQFWGRAVSEWAKSEKLREALVMGEKQQQIEKPRL